MKVVDIEFIFPKSSSLLQSDEYSSFSLLRTLASFVLKPVKDRDGAEDVNDQFAVIKVVDRVAVLENKVAAMEKRRSVNLCIVEASVIVLLVAVYVIGSSGLGYSFRAYVA
ncbi:hypothetical protein PIB30_043048 [Stylosanthes scabra]|uniref:Transmembrane protein n=1 Tax=Stylosanthes scabra TaxID=79078 RepID=A0ABU6ZE59_9FABA|nr:hypothetical protein [Stylosanthes scabra]